MTNEELLIIRLKSLVKSMKQASEEDAIMAIECKEIPDMKNWYEGRSSTNRFNAEFIEKIIKDYENANK